MPRPLAAASTPITTWAVAWFRRNKPPASSTYPASSPPVSATITTELPDRASSPNWRATASGAAFRSAASSSMNDVSRSSRCFSRSSAAASPGPAVRIVTSARPPRAGRPGSPDEAIGPLKSCGTRSGNSTRAVMPGTAGHGTARGRRRRR